MTDGPDEPDEPDDPLDARELVGLLADADRRAVVAALVLGATGLDEVRATTGLDARRAGRAATRLVESGLVVRSEKGELWLVEAAFGVAARTAARTPAVDEHPDEPPERARVLRAFFARGRLTSIPAQHSKRLVVLDRLAQEFEPGHRYTEKQVNTILRRFHDDVAALRRYLVDDDFMEREKGVYWRAGGTYDVESS